MNTHARRVSTWLAATVAVGGGLVVVAPSAFAQNCIASSYTSGSASGYRSWCAPAAGGTYFRTVTTCRDAWRPGVTYNVTGSWEVQGGNSWSYAMCRGGDSPVGVAIQKGS